MSIFSDHYMREHSLRSQVLIPLTLALVLIIAVFVVVVSHFQKQNIDQSVNSRFKSVQDMFVVQLDNDAAMMGAVLEVVMRDGRSRPHCRRRTGMTCCGRLVISTSI